MNFWWGGLLYIENYFIEFRKRALPPSLSCFILCLPKRDCRHRCRYDVRPSQSGWQEMKLGPRGIEEELFTTGGESVELARGIQSEVNLITSCFILIIVSTTYQYACMPS